MNETHVSSTGHMRSLNRRLLTPPVARHDVFSTVAENGWEAHHQVDEH